MASALYLTFYYLGGTLGSVLSGLAWQAAGWPGVLRGRDWSGAAGQRAPVR